MVGIEKVKRGLARYLDDEFTNNIGGWQRWVFGAAAGMYIENMGETLKRLSKSELVKGLGVVDETGNIDVDKLRRYFLAEAQKGPITFVIPVIGAVTLNEGDVEKLYRYIMEG